MRSRARIALVAGLLVPATIGAVAAPRALIGSCAVGPAETYLDPPVSYPRPSDVYSVEYRIGGGAWTSASTYVSDYGATDASPFASYSGYPAYGGGTAPSKSLSFVSIPARPSAVVELQVTKLSGPFLAGDHVTVRPRITALSVAVTAGTARILSVTGPGFAGDQFALWWGPATGGSEIAGLVFFLNPPSAAPTTGSIKVVTQPSDLESAALSGYDTLSFNQAISIGSDGAHALDVPPNITTIYLGPNAWVQGKFHFVQSGGQVRRVYGPGVLDVSRFNYALRTCGPGSGFADQGENAISWDLAVAGATPDTFVLDGFVITDHNHAATDLLVNSRVNNVKTISWNGVNGGLRLGDGTSVTNVFLHAADDSLMLWGSGVSVTNATIWQGYNGGVVNLGWFDDSTGDQDLIDGLFVIRTDWLTPPPASWTVTTLNDQNNAVFASLQSPGTHYGQAPSTVRNVFIDDPPQVLFSLKILEPDCNLVGLFGSCPHPVDLTLSSLLNLNIQNLITPPSLEPNSIGFQTLPAGVTYEFPAGTVNRVPTDTTLPGTMSIGLTNVVLVLPGGVLRPLTAADAGPGLPGQISTMGAVSITYGLGLGKRP